MNYRINYIRFFIEQCVILYKPEQTPAGVCLKAIKKEENRMTLEGILIICLIGGIAGWLAGVLVKGFGFGIVANIVVGIIGAFVGSWLFGVLGISVAGGILGSIIVATIGAVVLLLVIGVIRKATK